MEDFTGVFNLLPGCLGSGNALLGALPLEVGLVNHSPPSCHCEYKGGVFIRRPLPNGCGLSCGRVVPPGCTGLTLPYCQTIELGQKSNNSLHV